MQYKTKRIEEEFLGNRTIALQLDDSGNLTTVIFSSALRAMTIAADYECRRIYGVELMVTDCLRTWEEQDEIYVGRDDAYTAVYEEHGAGYHPDKFISPHQCGRGDDVVPMMTATTGEERHRRNKVYSHIVNYLNTTFPYCWNSPGRLIRNGRIVESDFKTARDHEVKGRHIHIQLSWGSFAG